MTTVTVRKTSEDRSKFALVEQIRDFQSWIKTVSDRYDMPGKTDREVHLLRMFCFLAGAWEESLEMTDTAASKGYSDEYLVELGDYLNYILQIHREMNLSMANWINIESALDLMSPGDYGDVVADHSKLVIQYAGTLKRVYRGDPGTEKYLEEFNKATQDLVISLLSLAKMAGFSTMDVIIANQKKLQGRIDRGTLTGRGDKR